MQKNRLKGVVNRRFKKYDKNIIKILIKYEVKV
jgi:hypothetical protein